MSIFKPAAATCPSCEGPVALEASASVNADRRPDLREAILDDSLQRGDCAACGAPLRLDPELTYFDQALGLWIWARPFQDLPEWREQEARAEEVHRLTFGVLAPQVVQDMGAALTPRLTFGWAALREKILCKLHGIDDATLELAKVGVLRASGRETWDDEVELRLAQVQGEDLGFVWLKGAAEEPDGFAALPRAWLADVEADPETFAALRARVVGPFFVDLNRALAEDEPEP